MVGKAKRDAQLNVKFLTFSLPPPQWFPHSKKKSQAPNPKTQPPKSVMGEKWLNSSICQKRSILYESAKWLSSWIKAYLECLCKGAGGPALACGQPSPVLAIPGLKRGEVQKAKGLGKNLQTVTEQAVTSLGNAGEMTSRLQIAEGLLAVGRWIGFSLCGSTWQTWVWDCSL